MRVGMPQPRLLLRFAGSQGAGGRPLVRCEGRREPVEDFVFTTSIGTPLEGRNVTKRFQKLLADASIPRHRFHDLRHTAASLLAVQGIHPKAIQAVLGWDQVANGGPLHTSSMKCGKTPP